MQVIHKSMPSYTIAISAVELKFRNLVNFVTSNVRIVTIPTKPFVPRFTIFAFFEIIIAHFANFIRAWRTQFLRLWGKAQF